MARAIYIQSRTPAQDVSDWSAALRSARVQIAGLLRASAYLTDIPAALQKNGGHTLVLRHLLAPPISQDQFSLICAEWRKSGEKSGRPMPQVEADCVTATFHTRRSPSLTTWLDRNRNPTTRELRRVFFAVAPLIASQQVQTIQRNGAAAAQEGAVVKMLEARGWKKLPAKSIDTLGALPFKHFSHKTRFATKSLTPQEVDLALGLQGTVVLAMECKVSNDGTNSVKRVNDVIKKATAWKDHWGNFVRTAALLQGVIEVKDVNRLLDQDIEVFWSHDLGAFETWLDGQSQLAQGAQKAGKGHP